MSDDHLNENPTRANSLVVPDDWYNQAIELEVELEEIEKKQNEELGAEAAELRRRNAQIVYSKEDAKAYFETLLATPELYKIIQKQMEVYRNPDLEDDRVLMRARSRFFSWWVLSRASVNSWVKLQMNVNYNLATVHALAEYVNSGNIRKSYSILERDLSDRGFE